MFGGAEWPAGSQAAVRVTFGEVTFEWDARKAAANLQETRGDL